MSSWIKTFAEVRALVGDDIDNDELCDSILGGDVKIRRRFSDRTTELLKPGYLTRSEFDLTNMRLGIEGPSIYFIVGPPPPPAPLEYFDLEIDRASLLENFPLKARAWQPMGTKRFSEAEITGWVRDSWLPSLQGRIPDRDEMVKSVRGRFGDAVPIKFIYQLKSQYAPGKSGRPKAQQK
jgi:hypothetical protein